jgi:GNAT superfamily N-acetyltransferase
MDSPIDPAAIEIMQGYRAGAIGSCVELHAKYYARAAQFGAEFEAVVASGLAEFVRRLHQPCNGFWLAKDGDRVVGTIAIDGEDLGPGRAHLRWFIVDDQVRGAGIGRRLLSHALQFCDELRFAEVHLWTFQGLDAARHLYEAHAFTLTDEREGVQWGKKVLEQQFVRTLASRQPITFT